MKDHVLNFMRQNQMVIGDPGLDRRTYISLAYAGDIDPGTNPLDAELEAELPFEFRQVRPLHEN
jgi:hypothetical protein